MATKKKTAEVEQKELTPEELEQMANALLAEDTADEDMDPDMDMDIDMDVEPTAEDLAAEEEIELTDDDYVGEDLPEEKLAYWREKYRKAREILMSE